MKHFTDKMGWKAHDSPHAEPGPAPADTASSAGAAQARRPRTLGMPWRPIHTGSSHAMIAVSRVLRAGVYDRAGRAAGEIADLSVDKSTGRVAYAIVSFGSFFGLRMRFHPIPWSLLRYDTAREAYVTPLTVAELDAAPSLTPGDLEAFGAGDRAWRDRIAAYYNPLLQLGAL